jgi:hypothetical protein
VAGILLVFVAIAVRRYRRAVQGGVIEMFSWLAKLILSRNMARLREGDYRMLLRGDANDLRFRFPGDSSFACRPRRQALNYYAPRKPLPSVATACRSAYLSRFRPVRFAAGCDRLHPRGSF